MPFLRPGRAAAALLSLVLLLAWDATDLDFTLARLVGGASGFSLRDDWWLSTVLHDGMRLASWTVVLALCAGVVWPVGPLSRLPFARRLQLPASALLATGLVVALKGRSGTSCPWDLSPFGGVAQHLSHWRGWTVADGGSGRCFPAGHAAAGFAFVGGYFAWHETLPRLARAWLAAAVVAGFALGAVQQLRGAHFMSHTLWTGWICWMVAWGTDPFFGRAARAGWEPAP